MRAFIGIELPDVIKNNIFNTLQEKGFYNYPNLTFVKKENFHITIAFLGDQNKEELLEKLDFIQDFKNNFFSYNFPFSAYSIGAFPNRRKPSVIWIGIKDYHDILTGVGQLIYNELFLRGIIEMKYFKPEKHYKPHITVARNRKRQFIPLKKFYYSEYGTFSIKYITLFESKLTPNGPIYTIIKRF